MKKIIFSLFILLAVVSPQSHAAKLLTWGVEGGLTVNKLSFSSDLLSGDNRVGFFIGPKLKVKIPLLGFGVDAAVLYSMNRAGYNCDVPALDDEGNALLDEAGNSVVTTASASRNLSYFEIPVNLRYNFTVLSTGIYIATGPQFNACISSQKACDAVLVSNRTSWGWNLGAGVELFNHLQLGVTYTFPLSKVGDLEELVNLDNYKNIDVTNHTVKVRLAYFF